MSEISLISIQHIKTVSLEIIKKQPTLNVGGKVYTVTVTNNDISVSRDLSNIKYRTLNAIKDFFSRALTKGEHAMETRANQLERIISAKIPQKQLISSESSDQINGAHQSFRKSLSSLKGSLQLLDACQSVISKSQVNEYRDRATKELGDIDLTKENTITLLKKATSILTLKAEIEKSILSSCTKDNVQELLAHITPGQSAKVLSAVEQPLLKEFKDVLGTKCFTVEAINTIINKNKLIGQELGKLREAEFKSTDKMMYPLFETLFAYSNESREQQLETAYCFRNLFHLDTDLHGLQKLTIESSYLAMPVNQIVFDLNQALAKIDKKSPLYSKIKTSIDANPMLERSKKGALTLDAHSQVASFQPENHATLAKEYIDSFTAIQKQIDFIKMKISTLSKLQEIIDSKLEHYSAQKTNASGMLKKRLKQNIRDAFQVDNDIKKTNKLRKGMSTIEAATSLAEVKNMIQDFIDTKLFRTKERNTALKSLASSLELQGKPLD